MYIVLALWDLGAMCNEKQETDIYVVQNWSQLIEGSVLEMNKW